MSVEGTIKFNAVAVAEVEANMLGPSPQLSGKAAFVDTRTGKTHGWTSAKGIAWSKETIEALDALCECMNQDLARIHMAEYTSESTGVTSGMANITGLSEHLNSEEGTQL
jgi:hypothetical protein